MGLTVRKSISGTWQLLSSNNTAPRFRPCALRLSVSKKRSTTSAARGISNSGSTKTLRRATKQPLPSDFTLGEFFKSSIAMSVDIRTFDSRIKLVIERGPFDAVSIIGLPKLSRNLGSVNQVAINTPIFS
jgi:hypothetical protein